MFPTTREVIFAKAYASIDMTSFREECCMLAVRDTDRVSNFFPFSIVSKNNSLIKREKYKNVNRQEVVHKIYKK